jgi:hypothetical protein
VLGSGLVAIEVGVIAFRQRVERAPDSRLARLCFGLRSSLSGVELFLHRPQNIVCSFELPPSVDHR